METTPNPTPNEEIIPDVPHGLPYAMAPEWLLDMSGVDFALGLSQSEVGTRRAEFGPNTIGPAEAVSAWYVLSDQFRGAVVWLRIAAAGLSIWMRDCAEALAIIAVLVLNTAIGFFTEMRPTRSMEALRRLTPSTARVRRDGREHRVDAEELVPRDIVLLDAGDVVPTDFSLIEAADINVDEST